MILQNQIMVNTSISGHILFVRGGGASPDTILNFDDLPCKFMICVVVLMEINNKQR